MKSYTIVTDSSANLPISLVNKYELVVLPLVYYIGEEEHIAYTPTEEQSVKDLYAKMRAKTKITTSCPNSDKYFAEFSKILDKGQDILYIGFSSGLSATYQSACISIEELKEKYPERKILSIDSLSASLGQGLLVSYAADFRLEGKSIEEVYAWLLENRLHLCHWFTVDDLFHLKRGGRVSTTTAIAGSLLNIKPVLHVDNEGHLIPVDKTHGRKKSISELVKHMEETIINPVGQRIFISHGDCIEDAEFLAKLIRAKWDVGEILMDYVEPVIAAHSGPGTLALFFLGTQR